MKFSFFLASLLVLGISATAQITTAENGLNNYPNTTSARLGGTLLQNTYIDLSSYNLYFRKDGNFHFTILNNGNIGIGTGDPNARLTFQNAGIGEDPIGMSWGSNSDPLEYGIHRTAGSWSYPNYQQLRLGWLTGIVLDPGTNYGKSYVDIKGNGLRVTSGNVGIGTTTPHSKLEVGTNAADDLSPYTSTIWDNYSARFNNGNVSIFSSGETNTSGDSYQLNFYGRYWDGGQGRITNKASYIKGSVVTVRANEASPWEGRGTLVLGSSNTSYAPNQFTDVPAMYITNGQVGVGIASPESQFHTTGSVRFAGLTNDNAKDRVIVSDANGNLSYRDAATLGGSSTAGWVIGGNSATNPTNDFIGTTDAQPLVFRTDNAPRMRILPNGNLLLNKFEDNGSTFQAVGNGSFIGPTGAGAVLFFGDNMVNNAFGVHTYGDASGENRYTTIGHNMWETGAMYNSGKQGGGMYLDDRTGVLPIRFMIKPVGANASVYAAGISSSGNFLIGNSADQAGYKLQVDGNIRTRKVRVDQDTWADYVFESNYRLRSIKEVEEYIQAQKHLPDVPSATEVKKEGLDVGDNQVVLLKKIEELTLYIIQQQKQLEAQQKRIDLLEKKVDGK